MDRLRLLSGRTVGRTIYLGLRHQRRWIWVPSAPPSMWRWPRWPDIASRRLHAAEHMAIHALRRAEFPDGIARQPMSCPACGTTAGLVAMLAGLAWLLTAILPPAAPVFDAAALPVGVHAWLLGRGRDCERPTRNPLVTLSRWVQERWLLAPPGTAEMEQAVARGDELLAVLARLE